MSRAGNLSINDIYTINDTPTFEKASAENIDITDFIVYIPLPSRYLRKGDIVKYNDRIYFVSAIDSLYVSLADWLDQSMTDVCHSDLTDFKLVFNWIGDASIHGDWTAFKAFIETSKNYQFKTLYPDFYAEFSNANGSIGKIEDFIYYKTKDLIEARCDDMLY